jgi:hypothetical protein
MAIIVKAGADFIPAPDGIKNAVCVDVIDRGMVTGQYGPKHKLQLVWETEDKMEDGTPFTVRRLYGASLHEKSTLHRDLKAWRGQAFTKEELAGFDIEKVVGKPCMLVLTHDERDGQVYCNVSTIAKAGDKKLVPSGKYVRVKDRPKDQQQNGTGNANGINNPDADEFPF